MDIWSILGIEPTREIAKIKMAYARQLKRYHPEDDPKGFQHLREAYDCALQIAKQFKDNLSIDFNLDETNIVDNETIKTIEDTDIDQLFSTNWENGPEINEENSPLLNKTLPG